MSLYKKNRRKVSKNRKNASDIILEDQVQRKAVL